MLRCLGYMGIVLSICPLAAGQELLTNTSFADPLIVARAEITIRGNVVDGDTIEIDVTGADRVYEFDTGGGISGTSDVAVNVSGGTDKVNAGNQLIAAVNGDALSPVIAADGGGLINKKVLLSWGGPGGGLAQNTNTHDANSIIDVTNFTNPLDCQTRDTQPVTNWFRANPANPGGVPLANRKAEIGIPAFCDANGHASIDAFGAVFHDLIYQPVSGLNPANTYTFTGEWAVGQNQGIIEFYAELHEGLFPDRTTDTTLIAQQKLTKTTPGQYDWIPFAVSGSPAGTDVTVVIEMHRPSGAGGAMWVHADNVSLQEAVCTVPTVTGITPAEVFSGALLDDVQLTGTGFVPGSTTVSLISSSSAAASITIAATDVQVSDANHLTCDVDLSGESISHARAVVVEIAGCGGNSLIDALNVVAAGPFENGGFENPDPGNTGCSAATENIGPTRWQFNELGGFGFTTALYRDELDIFPPSCPPPDGAHYASSTSNAPGTAQEMDRVFQTISVTPATTYTFFGFLAGGGNNDVFLELLDGDGNSTTELGSFEVYSGTGAYDWTFAAVSGTPTGSLMTAQYRIHLTGAGPHAMHADDMNVEVCSNPITVTGVTPSSGVNTGTVTITNLAGTDFNTSVTPKVLLSGGGRTIEATNAVVAGTTQITCEFDLTGLASGDYDVIVLHDGCVDILEDGFLVVTSMLLNGGFEDPTVPLNCGSLANSPSGWNFNDDRFRDHFVHQPTCPNPQTGGHYGSMTTGADRGFQDQHAWQTISVTPGQVYSFGGWFAGGGTNRVTIRLRDGGLAGTILAETIVYDCTSSCSAYDWTEDSVTAMAPGSVMTVEWHMSNATDDSATHADGLTFVPLCNVPFADADADGDIDGDDFAELQICLSGTDPLASGCECFDRDGNGMVNQADLSEFEDCGTGPTVLYNPLIHTACNP